MNSSEKRPSRKFFVFYCVILFLFAAILIFVSYLSHMQVEEQLDNTTETFSSRLEAANEEKAALDKTIVEQKTKIEELEEKLSLLTDADKKAVASEYLWQLIKAYASDDEDKCLEIIEAIDAEELRPYLSEDAMRELSKIEKITKGE